MSSFLAGNKTVHLTKNMTDVRLSFVLAIQRKMLKKTKLASFCNSFYQVLDGVFLQSPPEGSPYYIQVTSLSYEDWLNCPSVYDKDGLLT